MNDNTISPAILPHVLVHTAHILVSGQIIYTLKEFQQVEHRFEWVSRKEIIEKIIHLRSLTRDDKKSVLAIYESGHQIKEYVNVESDFSPLSFC
jgi:hypothetical protein